MSERPNITPEIRAEFHRYTVATTLRNSQVAFVLVALLLPAGSKAAALEGCWDPVDGEDKALWLRYEFLGRVHEAVVEDEAPLKCPLKSA